mgnify:CR=1 FL=1
MSEDKRRIEVNWVQSTAGALAAVTSAVLLSTVGVAGTLIGAALGSLAATVGSAVSSYYIRTTQDRVASAGTVAVTRIGHGRARGPSTPDEAVGEDLHPARAAVEDEKNPPAGGFTTILAGLPWKRIAVVSTGLFVAAMLVILAFELVTGRAVSSYTGGSDPDRRTSIPGLGSGAGAGDGDQDQQQPAPEQAPGDAPDDGAGDLEQPDSTPTAGSEETAEPQLEDEPAETETAEPAPASTPTPMPSEPVEPAPSP